jgi:hypothetical protein
LVRLDSGYCSSDQVRHLFKILEHREARGLFSLSNLSDRHLRGSGTRCSNVRLCLLFHPPPLTSHRLRHAMPIRVSGNEREEKEVWVKLCGGECDDHTRLPDEI